MNDVKLSDNAEMEAYRGSQLVRCRELLDLLRTRRRQTAFSSHWTQLSMAPPKEDYEENGQPMDMGTILGKLEQPPEHRLRTVAWDFQDVNRNLLSTS
jgi:hypothetical protein